MGTTRTSGWTINSGSRSTSRGAARIGLHRRIARIRPLRSDRQPALVLF
jgi:hypothetical protein